MAELQWTVTALGLAAATLGCCLLAIIAHDAERRRRWIVYAVIAGGFAAATVAFALLVHPQVHAG